MPWRVFLRSVTGRQEEVWIDKNTTLRAFKEEAARCFDLTSSDVRLFWIGRNFDVGASWWNGIIESEEVLMDYLNPGVVDGYPPLHIIFETKSASNGGS